MSDGNAFDTSDSESDTEATEYTCSSCQETFLSNCKGVSVFKCLCRLCHDNYKKETLKSINNDSSDDNEEDFHLPRDVVNKTPDENDDARCGNNFNKDITNDIDSACNDCGAEIDAMSNVLNDSNDMMMDFSRDCGAEIDEMSSVLNDSNDNVIKYI